tara:strand:+ start:814 stop:987 length:174 start_codon:yes stop_codon:yes gene_type:complete
MVKMIVGAAPMLGDELRSHSKLWRMKETPTRRGKQIRGDERTDSPFAIAIIPAYPKD